MAHDILQNVLDLIEKKVGKRTEMNDTLIDQSDEDGLYEDYHLNTTTVSDDEEMHDDYLLEHDDL